MFNNLKMILTNMDLKHTLQNTFKLKNIHALKELNTLTYKDYEIKQNFIIFEDHLEYN